MFIQKVSFSQDHKKAGMRPIYFILDLPSMCENRKVLNEKEQDW